MKTARISRKGGFWWGLGHWLKVDADARTLIDDVALLLNRTSCEALESSLSACY